MKPEIVSIEGKTDIDRAAEYKKRTVDLIEPFLRLKDEAAREGFLITWAMHRAGCLRAAPAY